MKKLFGVILLLILVLPIALAQTSSEINKINERLERNKAEIIKEIKGINIQNEELIKQGIDDNFAVLDERMDNKLKNHSRDIAVIIVAGFIGAFAISQVIKLKLEQMKRKALLKSSFELEQRVHNFQIQATNLLKSIRRLKVIENEFDNKLQDYKKRIEQKKFPIWKIILFGFIAFILGGVIMWWVM